MGASLIRTLAIVFAFVVGYSLPELSCVSWLIRWLIIGMLYITFLGVRFGRMKPDYRHWLLVLSNILMGILPFFVLKELGYDDLAMSAFFVGITPTATAAPVVMGFLGGSVEFVLTSLIVVNAAVCALIPLIMPMIVGQGGVEIYFHMAGSIGMVMVLPLILALITRRVHIRAFLWPRHLKDFSFGLWVLCLVLIAAHASDDIRSRTELSHSIILWVGVVSLIICAVNFGLGYLLGGPDRRRECSQSLGQKNTTLTIFLAMIYAPSAVASLGPTFYVLWHNLWNAWQLHCVGRKAKKAALISREQPQVPDGDK
jgi:BASS family bile acid:Na+ symporter